jgi:hypothetical protein
MKAARLRRIDPATTHDALIGSLVDRVATARSRFQATAIENTEVAAAVSNQVAPP